MTRLRKQVPALQGAGELSYGGYHAPVEYEVKGEPSALRLGPLRLHGSVNTLPEVAAEVFRVGEARLRLESGEVFRITLVGHSAGSGVAYFEMRV